MIEAISTWISWPTLSSTLIRFRIASTRASTFGLRFSFIGSVGHSSGCATPAEAACCASPSPVTMPAARALAATIIATLRENAIQPLLILSS